MPKPQILTPEQFVNEVESALPQSISTERKRLLEQARAWAVVSYDGEMPEALAQRIQSLEAQYGNAR
jgi:hypothetical protein